jgi:succinyl-diaminopimelate desuccinylase
LDKQEKIKVLTDLIAINSVNGNEVAVAKYLATFLAKYGILAKVDCFGDNRANLVAEFGEHKTQQVFCLTGHQDTVAVADKSQWHSNPFQAKITGDRLYGRGSADMKSGLAAEVIVLAELAEQKKTIPGVLKLVATAGEEFGTPGAYRLAKQGLIDDVQAMIVGEPTDGQIVYAHAGTINYQIKSYGKAVHSSAPEAGINAISGLVAYINAEPKLFADDPGDSDLGKVKHSITIVKGGSQINIIPDQAELFGNIRPTPAFSNEKVIAVIKDQLAIINQQTKFKLEFSLLHNFYPVKTDPQTDFVQQSAAISASHFPCQPIKLTTINGATDASVFVERNPQIKTIVLGPAAWKNAHQIDEYTTISSFLAMTNIYQEIVQNYFKTENK